MLHNIYLSKDLKYFVHQFYTHTHTPSKLQDLTMSNEHGQIGSLVFCPQHWAAGHDFVFVYVSTLEYFARKSILYGWTRGKLR